MKTLVLWIVIFMTTSLSAQAQGEHAGGGDSKSEGRIKGIRDNILEWINVGNDRGLKFTPPLTQKIYEDGNRESRILGMKSVLDSKLNNVVVNVIHTAEEDMNDFELNTWIDGKPKTCKWFISTRDGYNHILCNYERFWEISEAEQYRLIHHEYAGLAGVELSSGADSDYSLSNQISSTLEYEQVLRLPVTRTSAPASDLEEFFTRIDSEMARGTRPSIQNLVLKTPILLQCVQKDGELIKGPSWSAVCVTNLGSSSLPHYHAEFFMQFSANEFSAISCEKIATEYAGRYYSEMVFHQSENEVQITSPGNSSYRGDMRVFDRNLILVDNSDKKSHCESTNAPYPSSEKRSTVSVKTK